MQRLVKKPFIFVGIPAAVLILAALFWSNLGNICADSSDCGALNTEIALVQTAMNAMMADLNLATVTANDDTTGSLGVNTWTDLPEGPAATSLDSYLKKSSTKYFFCWDRNGNVWPQNKEDGVKVKPEYAKLQGPCKKAPLNKYYY